MYYACYSPLAKIFQKEFVVTHRDPKTGISTYEKVTQRDLMTDPERVFKEEMFSIRVEKGSGDLIFQYATPRLYTDPNIANWISGGDDGLKCQETECYGIAKILMPDEIQGAMNYFVSSGKQVSSDVQEALAEAQKRARDMSHMRVMRAVVSVHSALKKQYELNKENNMGLYTPSPAEFLCAYVLAESEKKDADSKSKVTAKFKELMDQTMMMST